MIVDPPAKPYDLNPFSSPVFSSTPCVLYIFYRGLVWWEEEALVVKKKREEVVNKHAIVMT